MLSGIRIAPRHREQFPGILTGARIYFGTLPGPVIDFHLDALQGRAIVQYKTGNRKLVGHATHPNDCRFEINARYGVFNPALLVSDTFFFQSDVIATHKPAHVSPVLHVNLGQPLHVCHPVKPGNKQPDRAAMTLRQSFSIHLQRQHVDVAHRIGHRQTSGEGLLNFRLPDFLDADVAAEKHDFLPFRLNTGRLKQISEPHAAPVRVANQALKNPERSIAATLEARIEIKLRHSLQVREGVFDGIIHQTRDLQTVARQIKLRLTVVLDHIKILVVCVKAV